MKRLVILIALATWPLLVGAALDVIDFLIGDPAQGAAWSFAGMLGVVTASTPTTLACFALRLTTLPACLATGAPVAVLSGGALVAWALFVPIDPLAGPIYLLAATLVFIGAAATGAFAWLIRRPDRDTPPNPPTSAP